MRENESKKTIIRVVKDRNNPYLMLNKTSINDCRLSAKAKGIHVYLLSLPDDWKIYIEELTKHFSDGRDSISSGIKELINSGYIVRERLRNPEGKFGGYEYIVFETPQITASKHDAEQLSSINGKPENGKSVNGKSVNGKSPTTKYPKKQIINKQKNNTHKEEPVCVTSISDLRLYIRATTGFNISEKKVKALLSSSTLERIQYHLDNWHIHKQNQKRECAGYFITVVENDIEPVMPQQQPNYSFNKIPHRDNFDQREYSDEELERYYANLRE